MASRSTRNRVSTRSAVPAGPSSSKTRVQSKRVSKRTKPRSASTSESQGEDEEELEEQDVSEVESLDSEALDSDDVAENTKSNKRKRVVSVSKKLAPPKANGKMKTPKKVTTATHKKRKITPHDESEDPDSELDLAEGQEVVGVVVQAPKAGRVSPGQISKNTLSFLTDLKKPECNDREWFKLHEPIYRLAEGEWKAFIEHFTDLLVEVDPQIPHLPPKDVIHRIYRDVRFSNDKTPYKTGLSASFSRSGRKGIFAGYHIAIKPGGESLIAAGSWCPGKNELQTIRNNLLRSTRRLRRIISAPEFEALFGPAKPHPKGVRQNVFGFEDELKVAPKGVDKNHKDIDLLKCRSFAVVHKFTDKQVLSVGFKDELANVAKIMRPFVHCLNDLMTIQDAGSDDSEDSEGGDDDLEDGEDGGSE
ncbi:hypothetical protein ONZ51_g12239 [Trametes cubensis]|uniref:DUF2461 domain-containing protein n=1 Tax=Trametes cubensis TaxID=1111947 RepID=A0AAD7X4S3_9APHY|nr:hypothetical protein ONZ51_g12239 [Trametes cubensis]